MTDAAAAARPPLTTLVFTRTPQRHALPCVAGGARLARALGATRRPATRRRIYHAAVAIATGRAGRVMIERDREAALPPHARWCCDAIAVKCHAHHRVRAEEVTMVRGRFVHPGACIIRPSLSGDNAV